MGFGAGQVVYDVDWASVVPVWALGVLEPTNNSTTLSSGSDLALAIPSAGVWALEGVFFYRSTAAAGLKINILGDASGIPHANIRWGIEGSQSMNFGNNALSITVPGTAFYRANIKGILLNSGGAAGTITLQYAQTTTNAGPTGPLAGRWLRAFKMSN